MATVFWGQAKDGKLSMGSEYNANRFKDFLRTHDGLRFKIDPLTPESNKQRNFFEGGVISLITYYQENLDYRDWRHCRKVRDWLLNEFSGEFVVIAGKSVRTRKTSRGELNKGLLDRILEWMDEQGYQTELLLPGNYKYWKDIIFPAGGPDNYIDYLLSIGKLRPRVVKLTKSKIKK